MKQGGGALVALSGGQDSTTCLYFALSRYDKVEAVSFDYGQRHRVELDCARSIADGAGVPHTILPVPALGLLGGASLTDPGIASRENAAGTGNTYAAERGLPSSFVPGRNAILLATAAAMALPRGLLRVVTGVCQMDRAGYPDCRAEFVTNLERTLRVGMDERRLEIVAPLLYRSKAETWALADQVGALEVVRTETHTCYNGVHDDLHEWGYGCGECPACQVRREGYEEFARSRSWMPPVH